MANAITLGALVLFKGRPFRIGAGFGDDNFILEPLDTSARPELVERTALEAAYRAGDLTFPQRHGSTDTNGLEKADISALPPPIRVEIRRRYSYVSKLNKEARGVWDTSIANEVIKHVASKLGDLKSPSIKTLKRWWRFYADADRPLSALVPNIHLRGNRKRRLDDAVIELMDEAIDSIYLTPERKPATDVHLEVISAIDMANKERSRHAKLKHPSLRTVQAAVAKLDPYLVCASRYGPRYADKKFRQTGRGIQARYAIERVQFDHSKLDLMVVDEISRLPIGRPWITVGFDVRTKVVVGFYIGFVPPSYLSLMHCFVMAILPKDWAKADYPSIRNPWPVSGRFSVAVVDNGKDFKSISFLEATAQLSIEIEYNNPGSPHHKGDVERFFGTLMRQIAHNIPGTTFSSVIERAEYDSAKRAVITLGALREVLVRYICDFYHVKRHRSLLTTPLDAYQKNSAEFPPPELPCSAPEISIAVGKVDERKLQHYGVEYLGLRYNCPELGEIRNRPGYQKSRIRINEEDLGRVHVYDDMRQDYLEVPCIEPEYATGLTLWQHKVIRKNAIALGRAAENISELSKTKSEIQAMVDAELSRTRGRTTTKVRAARWQRSDDAASPEVRNVPQLDCDAEERALQDLSDDGWGLWNDD